MRPDLGQTGRTKVEVRLLSDPFRLLQTLPECLLESASRELALGIGSAGIADVLLETAKFLCS